MIDEGVDYTDAYAAICKNGLEQGKSFDFSPGMRWRCSCSMLNQSHWTGCLACGKPRPVPIPPKLDVQPDDILPLNINFRNSLSIPSIDPPQTPLIIGKKRSVEVSSYLVCIFLKCIFISLCICCSISNDIYISFLQI